MRHFPSIKIVCIQILNIWWFIIFIVIVHIFITSFLLLSPLIHFSTINNLSAYVDNSNFISVAFKQTLYGNLATDKKLAESSSYISIYIYSQSFQIHLQVLIYHFRYTNYDNHLSFCYYSLLILFLYFYN